MVLRLNCVMNVFSAFIVDSNQCADQHSPGYQPQWAYKHYGVPARGPLGVQPLPLGGAADFLLGPGETGCHADAGFGGEWKR